MADVIELQQRTPGSKVQARALRKQQQVPGVLYGDHIESRHFSIPITQIPKLHKAGGTSGLIDVQLAGDAATVKAIVQDVERDAVSGNYEHIDLYQVRMDKKLHAEAQLEFTGESSAVKDLGGILVKQHNMLPIECLPGDLINHLSVPINALKTFDNVIRVSDLVLPSGVVTHLPQDEIIAAVSEPRTEEELTAELAGEITSAEPEVLTEKKKEEEGEGGADASDKNESSDKKE